MSLVYAFNARYSIPYEILWQAFEIPRTIADLPKGIPFWGHDYRFSLKRSLGVVA